MSTTARRSRRATSPQSLDELRAAALNIVETAEDIAAGADEIKRRIYAGEFEDERRAYRTIIQFWRGAISTNLNIR